MIAYEDPRVSERRIIAAMLERHGGDLERAGFVPAPPLDLLEDAIDDGLRRFRRARLTVSCSYHVTLTSLLAGTPAVLLADNDYYEQKAAGLRHLFEFDDAMIGVRGTPVNAATAAEALVDGPARVALIDHLHARSESVADRYEQGRAALSATLIGRLRGSTLRDAIKRRFRGG